MIHRLKCTRANLRSHAGNRVNQHDFIYLQHSSRVFRNVCEDWFRRVDLAGYREGRHTTPSSSTCVAKRLKITKKSIESTSTSKKTSFALCCSLCLSSQIPVILKSVVEHKSECSPSFLISVLEKSSGNASRLARMFLFRGTFSQL